MGRTKGQFFMIGSLVIAGLMAGILIYNMPVGEDSRFDNTKLLVERQAEEFPEMVSIMLKESRKTGRVEANLKSYMEHRNFVEGKHSMDSKGFLLVGVPVERGYNVTLGNFMGRGLTDVEITAGSDSETIGQVGYRRLETVDLEPEGEERFLVEVDFDGFRDNFTTDQKAFSMIVMNTTTEKGFWHVRKVN